MSGTPYVLRSGKRLLFPSLFIRPTSDSEAEITYNTISVYPEETDDIAGFACSIKDWRSMSAVLSDKVPRIVPYAEGFRRKIRIIDPDLHLLFTGPKDTKRELMNVSLENGRIGDISIPGVMGPVPLKRVVEAAIGEIDSSIPKAQNYANRFYSHTNRLTYGIEKLQIDAGADIVIGTYVPITSLSIAARQIEQETRLVRDSLVMFNRVFSAEQKVRDFMAMVAVNANILESDYAEDILELAVKSNADHIGLKLLNFNDKDPARAAGVLRFIESLRSRLDELGKASPIHLFNVMSEFAYAAFCHGAMSAVVPIATIPERHFDPNNPNSPEIKGRYYHPIDMTHDTYEELCAKTQAVDFALPCDCPACRSYETIMRALPHWPPFRKTHFIFLKSGEVSEIRKVPTPTLNIHLRDKFARSQATSYLPYLDYMYPYTVQ
jgi:hypothetical protein